MSLMLRQRPSKPYTTAESRQSVTEIIKNKSLYGFGGRCLDIKTVCMDFEPCFKVYNLLSVHSKSISETWSND